MYIHIYIHTYIYIYISSLHHTEAEVGRNLAHALGEDVAVALRLAEDDDLRPAPPQGYLAHKKQPGQK